MLHILLTPARASFDNTLSGNGEWHVYPFEHIFDRTRREHQNGHRLSKAPLDERPSQTPGSNA